MGATLKQFEAAIEKAGDAGDLEAVRELSRAMRQQLQLSNPSIGQAEPAKIGAEGLPQTIREMVKQFSRPEQVFAGGGSALALATHGVNQLTKPEGQQGPWNSLDSAEIPAWKALASSTPDTIGGNLLGNAMLFGATPARMLGLPGRLGAVADTALTQSGLNYATTPGTPYERATDAVIGGGLAMLPIGSYAAGSGIRQAVSPGGKRVAIGEGVLTEAGPNAENLISSLKAPRTTIGTDSAAMRTQEPMLQTLESGSRAKRGDLWKPFDRENARVRWDALLAKAGTPEELGKMRSDLNKQTGELREKALTDAQISLAFAKSGDVTPQMLDPITKSIRDLRFSKRPNKDVQELLNYVEGELKQGVTPGQMYEVRKVLTDSIKPGRTDQLSNAIKSSRVERTRFVAQIDDVLDTLSGGGWREYLTKHSAGSKPIESKQALQDMASSLERGMPTGVVPPVMGEAPGWKTVGTLRDRFGTKELGSKEVDVLLPEDRQLVDAIVDSLKRQADSMGAGKATLGSPTAPLLANAGRADAVTRNIVQNGISRVLPGGDILASKVFDKLGRQAEEELARLLQDPGALADAIASAILSRRMREGASRLGAASGAGSTGN